MLRIIYSFSLKIYLKKYAIKYFKYQTFFGIYINFESLCMYVLCINKVFGNTFGSASYAASTYFWISSFDLLRRAQH